MQQLSQDLKTLILNNWKTILAIVVIFYLLYSYSDIKQGIVDAWMNQ
jgi:hypothetical protein